MSHTSGTATDYRDLLEKLDAFLTATGHAWGKAFTGAGNGDLVNYIGTATSVTETFTITFTSATAFTVTGSTTGALATGTVDVPYSSAVIEFTITAGTTPFEVGDVFTIQTTPAWLRSREAGCPDTTYRTSNFTNFESALLGTGSTSYATATNAVTSGNPGGVIPYMEFEMLRPVEVMQITVRIDSTSNRPLNLKLQYRDNLVDPWVDAETWTAGFTQSNETKTFDVAVAPGQHKYWRLEVPSAIATELRLRAVQLHEHIGDLYDLASRFELIWQAPGLDGLQEINIGTRTYGSADTDNFSLGFEMWRQTDPQQSITGQPNASALHTLSLINAPIAYWIIANGQRFIIVAKFASLYQFAYAGYGNPYETPTVHPFPALIGGTWRDSFLRYSSTNTGFRNPSDPGESLQAFYPDGQWRDHRNRSTSGTPPDGQYGGSTPGKVNPSDMDFAATGSSGGEMPSDIRDNIDESRPLVPLVLIHRTSPAHIWGEFDGVYWTTGFNTVAEAIIREGLYDHLVVNNVYRNSNQHYAALRLD